MNKNVKKVYKLYHIEFIMSLWGRFKRGISRIERGVGIGSSSGSSSSSNNSSSSGSSNIGRNQFGGWSPRGGTAPVSVPAPTRSRSRSSSNNSSRGGSSGGAPRRRSPIVRVTHRDRKSTRLNSSHTDISRMPSSA